VRAGSICRSLSPTVSEAQTANLEGTYALIFRFRGGRLVVVDRRDDPARVRTCGVERDAPDPGFERAVAPERAALAHRGRKGLLHRITRSFRIAGHGGGDARENVEAAAVQHFELG